MTEHQTLASALAAFQADLPKLRKTETAKVTGESKNGGKVNYSYGYTGLDQVCEIVLPALGKHGLSITSKTVFTDGSFLLEVALLHEGGESAIGVWPLPDPRRMGPQDIGSAMTYGRRYLTLALTGTFPGGEDDDGAKAQTSARESWADAKPRPTENPDQPQQVAQQAKVAKTSWTDAEVFTIQEKMRAAALDKAIGAYDWMADKGLHNRVVGNPEDAAEPRRNATGIIADRLAAAALEPDAAPAGIINLRNEADRRGLLKTSVSETETLDQVLYEALDLAKHAAAAEASQDTPAS